MCAPAVRALPAGYARTGTLDLSARGTAITLHVVGVALLLPMCWLVLAFVRWARPDAGWPESLIAWTGSPDFAAAVVGATLGVVLVHEAIHGICFWAITHERPYFGLSGLSAYAAAPDWYIPVAPYVVIGLAPLVVITTAAVVLMLVLPPSAIGAAGVVLVLNGIGSIGDLAAVTWLLRFRTDGPLACDEGTRIAVYQTTRRPEAQ
jgi:hypothetical protein